MPSLVTHVQFAKDLAVRMESHNQTGIISQALKDHPGVYYLGAQAGDIFFYEGTLRFWNRKGLSGLGSEMHKHSAGLFFHMMLEQISESEKQNIPLAYYCGYLAHYLLDAFTHPFVYYWSGFAPEGSNRKLRMQAMREHFLLEKAIDVIFLETAYKEHVSELIAISKPEAYVLAPWLASQINSVYKRDITDHDIRKSIADMQEVYDFLRDPGGFKYRFFEALSGWSAVSGYVASNIYPQKIDTQRDYLNLQKAEWCMPWDLQICSRESFADLFEKALLEAVDILKLAEKYLQGNSVQDELRQKIANRSFSTGQDSSLMLPFVYSYSSQLKD